MRLRKKKVSSWTRWKAQQRRADLRETVKRREDKREDAVIARVRQACVERDGYCRFGRDCRMRDKCRGPSEWAHLDENRRWKTRGMDAEERHNVYTSAMVCRRHHRQYDAHLFEVEFHSDDYAEGRFSVVYRDAVLEAVG